MPTLMLIIIAIISYALGSFNGSIISSKYILKKDVRDYGSKNAGLTNFYRSFGLIGILLVIVIDVIKSVAAILIGGWLMGIVDEPMVGKIFAGFVLMLGHIYPAMFDFRGGKGVLCTGVLALMTDWRAGLICWAVFIGVVVFTRYVSLGSIIGCALFPLGIWIFGHGGLEGTLALLVFLLLAFSHRSNIVRLISRRENKLQFGGKSRPTY